MTAPSGIFRNDSEDESRREGGNDTIRRVLEAYWIGPESMTRLKVCIISELQKASRSDSGYAVYA